MRKKSDGIENAFAPYNQKEIDLILSLVPNKANTLNLAKPLGRSFDAIGMIFQIAYSGNMLKNSPVGRIQKPTFTRWALMLIGSGGWIYFIIIRHLPLSVRSFLKPADMFLRRCRRLNRCQKMGLLVQNIKTSPLEVNHNTRKCSPNISLLLF